MASTSRHKADSQHSTSSSSSSDVSDSSSESSSDSDAPLVQIGTWTKRDLSRDVPAVLDSFIPTVITDASAPIDCLRQYFDEEFIGYTIDQSNLYATHHNIKLTAPLTIPDFWKFIGCLLYMSCISLPRVTYYWKQATRQQILADSISRNRFLEILRVLHFNDPALEPAKTSVNYDKLYKIRPAIDQLNTRFLDAVVPEGFHSIDEQMIKWKGKTAPGGLKQYMPLKPISHGYKLYTRAGVSGYVYEVDLYSGKAHSIMPKMPLRSGSRKRPSATDSSSTTSAMSTSAISTSTSSAISISTFYNPTQSVSTPASVTDLGKSAEIVLKLSEKLPPNSRVYFDNYFGSVPLLKELVKMNIWAVWTLRANRIAACPIPQEKDMKKGPRGNYEYRTHSTHGVLVCAWYDNRRVILGSNYTGIQPVDTVRRFVKNQGGETMVQRPHIVAVYNKHMGGVDLADMMISLNPIERRFVSSKTVLWSFSTNLM